MRTLGRAVAAPRAFAHRHAWEFAIAVGLLVVGAVIWRFSSAEWGAAVLIAVGVGFLLSLAYTEQTFRERERPREIEDQARAARDAAERREHAAREDAEMRRIAGLANDPLLEAELWRDVDQWRKDYGTEVESTAPLAWSVTAVLARGRPELEGARIDGWREIADALRSGARDLASAISQEFPGPIGKRRAELGGVYEAAGLAAGAADAVVAARERAIALQGSGTPDEQETMRGLRARRGALFDALEVLASRVVALDPSGDVGRVVADSMARHRAAAVTVRARHRELQAIAAAAAEQLLRDLAPGPEDLARSSLADANGTLRDVVGADAFALAADDEEEALVRWRSRVAPAQRAFMSPVEGRGYAMDDRTRHLWTRIHYDGVSELENAILRLEGDVHAQRGSPDNFVEAIPANVAASRDELRTAMRRLISRVDELRALEV